MVNWRPEYVDSILPRPDGEDHLLKCSAQPVTAKASGSHLPALRQRELKLERPARVKKYPVRRLLCREFAHEIRNVPANSAIWKRQERGIYRNIQHRAHQQAPKLFLTALAALPADLMPVFPGNKEISPQDSSHLPSLHNDDEDEVGDDSRQYNPRRPHGLDPVNG
jgi:hypothetical protein